MNRFAKNLLLITALGTLGYLGYLALIKQETGIKTITHQTIDNLEATNNHHKELDMDLNHIASIEASKEPALTIIIPAHEEKPLHVNTQENKPILPEEEAAAEEPEVPTIDESVKLPEPVQIAEVKPQTPINNEKTLSKQEKMDKVAKNMEIMQKQAENEWNNMSPEEREEAEEQVEVFQSNFQNEIERLSQLSPEEVEQEKRAAMLELERQNPEAYEAVRNMEEMFMTMADAD